MSRIVLSTVMDAIAARLIADNVTKRAYAWPQGSVAPPCAVVGYPSRLDLDVTFQNASDEAVFPIWFIVGTVIDKAARKALSDIIAGSAATVKTSLDGNLGNTVQTARVTDVTIETITVGAIEYLSARFDLEVLT